MDNEQPKEEECHINHRDGLLFVVCPKCEDIVARAMFNCHSFKFRVVDVDELDTEGWPQEVISEQHHMSMYCAANDKLPTHDKCGEPLSVATWSTMSLFGKRIDAIQNMGWTVTKLSKVPQYIYRNFVKKYEINGHDLIARNPEKLN